MVLVLKDGQGYTVHRNAGAGNDYIQSVRCQFCNFSVRPATYSKQGDKSGLPRYNRARAAMVQHIYSEHFTSIHEPTFGADASCGPREI